MNLALDILFFAIAAVFIIFEGIKITACADEVADRTGIGKGFIGVLLLGMATSLPEVVTSVSSVVLVDATDMAIGNLLGSCTFNILIVVILDFMFRLKNAERSSVITGVLSLGMVGLVFLGYFVGDSLPAMLTLHPVSMLIVVAYMLSLWWIYRSEKKDNDASDESVETAPEHSGSAGALAAKTVFHASALIGTSIWMSYICDSLAISTGLGTTVVGALFMAMATSLPELAVSVSAMRMGQMSMSLGNIYGSNIFNIGIFALVDIAEGKGSLFDAFTSRHLILGVEVVAMTILMLIGFSVMKDNVRIARLRPAAFLTFIIYIAGTWFLFYNKLA